MNPNLAISLDTETLGIGDDAPIIQIGGVLFDLFDPPGQVIDGFEFYVTRKVYHNVEPYAAGMNGEIMMAIGKHLAGQVVEGAFVEEMFAAQVLWGWIRDTKKEHPVEKVVFTGKQYSGFDRPKLEKLPNWKINAHPVHHRSPDPGSMWWRPRIDGSCLPSTAVCMERAGITGEVAHTALQDATIIASLIQIWSQR